MLRGGWRTAQCEYCGTSGVWERLTIGTDPKTKSVYCCWSRGCVAAACDWVHALVSSDTCHAWPNVVTELSTHLGFRFQRAVNSLPDLFMCHGGGAASPAPTLIAGQPPFLACPLLRDAATNAPLSRKALEAMCSQAPFGRGLDTVVDTGVRRTLQADLSRVTFDWPLLEAVVAAAGTALCPARMSGAGFAAELHSVLLYRSGDFFRPHRDAKKSRYHDITMVVDCGALAADEDEREGEGDAGQGEGDPAIPRATCQGGAIVFGERRANGTPQTVVDESSHYGGVSQSDSSERASRVLPDAASWTSQGPGSWCAWFAEELHEVLPVTRGYRVVATFNVSVLPTMDAVDAVPPPNEAGAPQRVRLEACRVARDFEHAELASWATAPGTGSGSARRWLQRLPVEVVEIVASFLPAAAYAALGRCCERLRGVLLAPAGAMFTAWLREEAALGRACASAVAAAGVFEAKEEDEGGDDEDWHCDDEGGRGRHRLRTRWGRDLGPTPPAPEMMKFGYGLRHCYASHTAEELWFRGCDALVFEAMRTVFGAGAASRNADAVSVDPCVSIIEVVEQDRCNTGSDADRCAGAAMGRRVLDDESTRSWFRPRVQTELDEDPPFGLDPTNDVFWLNSERELAAQHTGNRQVLHMSHDLCGNSSQFRLYVYREFAIVASLLR